MRAACPAAGHVRATGCHAAGQMGAAACHAAGQVSRAGCHSAGKMCAAACHAAGQVDSAACRATGHMHAAAGRSGRFCRRRELVVSPREGGRADQAQAGRRKTCKKYCRCNKPGPKGKLITHTQ
jgi:hypothetical protein